MGLSGWGKRLSFERQENHRGKTVVSWKGKDRIGFRGGPVPERLLLELDQVVYRI